MVMLLLGDHEINVERDPLRIMGESLLRATDTLTENVQRTRHSFPSSQPLHIHLVLITSPPLGLFSPLCMYLSYFLLSVYVSLSVFSEGFFLTRALKQNVSTKRDEVDSSNENPPALRLYKHTSVCCINVCMHSYVSVKLICILYIYTGVCVNVCC